MATIVSGATSTEAIRRQQYQGGLVIQFPAAFTGTKLSVQGSLDGVNFFPVYLDGVAVEVYKVLSSLHVIPPSRLHGISWFKLVSDAAEAATRTVEVFSEKAI